MTALDKRKEMFPNDQRLRTINVIVEANGDNLITPEAFNEMV